MFAYAYFLESDWLRVSVLFWISAAKLKTPQLIDKLLIAVNTNYKGHIETSHQGSNLIDSTTLISVGKHLKTKAPCHQIVNKSVNISSIVLGPYSLHSAVCFMASS